MDPRGTVGRIYKEEHYTLLHTKYESSGPCGFGEYFFLCFTHDPPPPGRGLYEPQGHGRIYKEDHYTLLLMKALGHVVLENFFLCFTHDPPPPRAGPV